MKRLGVAQQGSNALLAPFRVAPTKPCEYFHILRDFAALFPTI